MGIKKYETRESLLLKLKRRGLEFDDKELSKALIDFNYFNLFNGLESILLDTKQPKSYKNISLNVFISLYHFNKKFRSLLLNMVNNVEEKLKSSISYHFTRIHCSNIVDTMQYTNREKYMNPCEGNRDSATYCPYNSNYPFKNYQNEKIYHGFNKFKLFKPYFLTNLVDKNDHIDIDFYKDENYIAPENVAIYRDKNGRYNNNIAVPFWVAIETLSFGETMWLLHYQKDDVMEGILNDFELPISKRNVFLNLLDFLLCLRNHCAHTPLVYRFRTSSHYKINNLLIERFSLNPRYTGNHSSVLKLYDALKLLSYFTNLSILEFPFLNIKEILIKDLGHYQGIKIHRKMRNYMGCEEVSDWIKVFNESNYTL